MDAVDAPAPVVSSLPDAAAFAESDVVAPIAGDERWNVTLAGVVFAESDVVALIRGLER